MSDATTLRHLREAPMRVWGGRYTRCPKMPKRTEIGRAGVYVQRG